MGSALALGVLVALNLFLVDTASGNLSLGSGSHPNDRPTVWYRHVDAEPGDLVWMNSGWLAGLPVELYVVEGGESMVFRDNRTPRHVYAHVPPPEPSPHGYGLTRIGLVRPPVPDDLEPPPPDAPLWHGTGLDFVWVLRPESAWDPRFVDMAQDRMAEGPDERTLLEFKVTKAWMVRLQPWLYAAEAAAAAGMLVGALGWATGARERRAPAAGAGVERALDLADRAESWLRSLRNLLAATGVGLLLLGFFLVAAMESLVRELYFTSPDLRWSLLMQWATGLAYLALLLTWALTLAGVQRELARWRRERARGPSLG